jgi:hypothetical protein
VMSVGRAALSDWLRWRSSRGCNNQRLLSGRRSRKSAARSGSGRAEDRSQLLARNQSFRGSPRPNLRARGDRPLVAGSVSMPECQEADINRQLRLIGNFKLCAPSRCRLGAWLSGRRSVGHQPDGTAGD